MPVYLRNNHIFILLCIVMHHYAQVGFADVVSLQTKTKTLNEDDNENEN